MITLALSKGRIFEETLPLLGAAGIEVLEDPEKSRKLILATNPSLEGDATAMYIERAARTAGVETRITRLARGLPVGGDIEYADQVTLARAVKGRSELG